MIQSQKGIDDNNSILLAEKLVQFKDLKKLNLNLMSNQIGVQGISLLIKRISECKNLSQLCLNIKENNFNYEVIEHLGKGIGNCQNLSELQLEIGNFEFGDQDVLKISEGIAQNKMLTSLILQISLQYQIEGIKGFASIIKQYENLTNLQLNINKMEDEGVQILSSAILQLKKLINLNLQFEEIQFNEEGISSLSSVISQLKYLTSLTLILNRTRICPKGASILGINIANCFQLTNLKIQFRSSMQEVVYESLFLGISQCINLTYLELSLRYEFRFKIDFEINIKRFDYRTYNALPPQKTYFKIKKIENTKIRFKGKQKHLLRSIEINKRNLLMLKYPQFILGFQVFRIYCSGILLD